MKRLCCPTCGRSYVLHRLTRDAEMRCPVYAGNGPRGVPLYVMGSGAIVAMMLVVALFASVPSWIAATSRPMHAKAAIPRQLDQAAMAPQPIPADPQPEPAPPPLLPVFPQVNQDPIDLRVPFKKDDWGQFLVSFKRLHAHEAEELLKGLKAVPEVGMTPTRQAQIEVVENSKAADRFKGPHAVLAMHPQLRDLPFAKGGECVLDSDDAQHLAQHSTEIRRQMPRNQPLDDAHRPFIVFQSRPAAVPALTQILQSENELGRSMLVEMLSHHSSPRATEGLVRRAVFDVDPNVRVEAVYALKHRPAEQYREKLLAMLDHPWDAAVQHAAEAIVNLDGAVTADDVAKVAHQPQPRNRVTVGEETHVREMVRMNHINNCLVCHAISSDRNDLVRAPVPEPYTRPAPLYYSERGGSQLLVRADVTYLRQDFAVMQKLPLEEAGVANKHPNLTYRFDYIVRTRPLRAGELAEAPMDVVDTVREEAIAFAMKGRR